MIKLTQKCFPIEDGWRIDLEYYCDKETTADEERRFFEELRKKTNWIKDDKGRFAGSVPEGGGKSGLTNGNKGGIMELGSDDVQDVTIQIEKESEYGIPYGSDAVNADMKYINSDRYASKFSRITGNPAVNNTLLECSRAAINHRTGTLYEDMYIINGNTGEIMGAQLEMNVPHGITHNDSIKSALNKANLENIPIIAFHSHPEGYPPSIDDFNSAYKNGYSLGVVGGHNGQVYRYWKPLRHFEYADDIQTEIVSLYNGGVDIDRACMEIFKSRGLSYEIVKE